MYRWPNPDVMHATVQARWPVCFVFLCVFLAGCGRGAVPENARAFSTDLARQPSALIAVSLPDSSRPDGARAPVFVPFLASFEQTRSDAGNVEWKAKLPFRTLYYDANSRRHPPEMQVKNGDGRLLPFTERQEQRLAVGRRWSYQRGHVFVVLAAEEGPPVGYTVSFPAASEAEAGMNRASAGLSDRDFVARTLPLYQAYRHGLFLPAPATAVFEVEVPISGVLRFQAMLLRPAVSTVELSDGAQVQVFVESEGKSKRVERVGIKPGDGERVRVSLAKYAGQTVRLRFEVLPGKSNAFDYVFLAEPVLYTPTDKPKRVVMVFVDTLRRDHMGVYGYDRDTTPNLDAWSKSATVFDQAYAPAPWTLPSARSAVSGKWPDDWDSVPHIGERFATAGWASFSVVTNAYISSAFGLAEGWSAHRANLAIDAQRQWDRARELLKNESDRDALLFLHLIDPHLPYKEPEAYRAIWAGEAPPPFDLEGVTARNPKSAWTQADSVERAAIERYVVDRYDQNIRYVDDVFGQIVKELGDEATIVFFSDHGEEFWEEGVIGHGHSLSQELVRVPLLMSGPGLAAKRVADPVGLIDIVPTLLDLLGMPLDDRLDGQSLVSSVAPRPLALGWTVFGSDAWGVVDGGKKWVSADGVEQVYDITLDPTEDRPEVSEVEGFREGLAEALGRPVWEVWRVVGSGKAGKLSPQHLKVTVRHPSGFDRVWARWDPMGERSEPVHEDGVVTSRRAGRFAAPREFFLKPSGSVDDVTSLVLEVRTRNDFWLAPGTSSESVLRQAGPPESPVQITKAVVPEPRSKRGPEGDEAVNAALRALGYMD